MKTLSPEEKLNSIFARCVKAGACMEWTGHYFSHPKKGRTYPYMYHQGKVWRGNRLVLSLVTRKCPPDMMALHHCDNPRCVNPEHLYWGTDRDNVRDMYQRKRARTSKLKSCPTGHPYSGKNLKLDRNGNRECLSCKWYHNRKMKPQKEIPPVYRD